MDLRAGTIWTAAYRSVGPCFNQQNRPPPWEEKRGAVIRRAGVLCGFSKGAEVVDHGTKGEAKSTR